MVTLWPMTAMDSHSVLHLIFIAERLYEATDLLA